MTSDQYVNTINNYKKLYSWSSEPSKPDNNDQNDTCRHYDTQRLSNLSYSKPTLGTSTFPTTMETEKRHFVLVRKDQ